MITLRKRIWSLANMMVEFFMGIGTIIFVTRLYPTKEAGSWFLFIAVFAMIGSLRDALIQAALVKDTAGKSGDELYTALKTNGLTTLSFEVILSTIVVLSSFYIPGLLGDLLRWYPLYAIPNALLRWHTFYLRSRLDLERIMYANVIGMLVLISGVVTISLLQLSVTSLVIALGAASLISMCYLMAFVPLLPLLKARLSSSHVKMIYTFGFFGMGREAVSAVSSRISLFITGTFLSLQHTAILGISQRFAQVALLPNNSFQSVLFPGLIQALQEKDTDKARKLFHDSLSLLLAITVPAAILGCIASPYLLSWISGPQYKASWIYLSIYVFIATVITPFGTAFGSTVTAWGKPQLAFRLVLINSIINCTLSFFLIKSMGLMGAPLAMVVTEISGFFWVGYLLKRTSNIRITDTFRQIPSVYYKWFRLVFPVPAHFAASPHQNKI